MGIGNWALGISYLFFLPLLPHLPHLPMPHAPCPMPHAPCPIQFKTCHFPEQCA
ncbi:hypothetical protein [Nostoc sp.]|uniref:hypothetical protein n=1 Tax=Nostoc sp. TaxID=1180 RepID=UPI002FFBCD12